MNTRKIELMNELINLYQQTNNMHDGETKQVVETYIKKLEKHLIILIVNHFDTKELLDTNVQLSRLWYSLYGGLPKEDLKEEDIYE